MENENKKNELMVITKKRHSLNVWPFLSCVCILFIIGISILIYMRYDYDANYFNKIFKTNITFKNINKQINNFFDNFFRFNIINEEDQTVSLNDNYIKTDGNTYISPNNNVEALVNGTIIEVNEEYVTIDYGQFDAIYYRLTDVIVKNGDRIKKGEAFSSYYENFDAFFYQNNKQIPYNELKNLI